MLSLVLAFAASVSDTDLEAHFKAGERLCTNPDIKTKTCANIDWMEARADGTLVNSGEGLVSAVPLYTLEVASTSHLENGKMCGSLDAEDLQRGIVRLEGKPLPPVENFAALSNLVAAVDHLIGMKVCEGLRSENGRLVKFALTDRKDFKFPDRPVRWIGADEGYRVGYSETAH